MDMSGSHRITASREEVWAALNDPAILKQCIPGCEEIEKQSDKPQATLVQPTLIHPTAIPSHAADSAANLPMLAMVGAAVAVFVVVLFMVAGG